MALFYVQTVSKFTKNFSLFTKVPALAQGQLSCVAVKKMSMTSKKVDENEIVKSVYISQSKNVFINLALEDWMYKNLKFDNHHIMLLWRNDPCVVIGRHQNPWAEANFHALENKGINLARRNSGGGTVYHDTGNLNVTFFTPRERYNRKQNLEILAKSLEREWNIRSEINKREDMVVDANFKISGTASKLGRPNSYHHCTLLVDVNKEVLQQSLKTDPKIRIDSTATKSTPAPTVNLCEINCGITMDKLIAAIGWEYLRTTPISQKDGGWDLVAKQNGFQLVNPTDEWFPGLEEIKNEFSSWDWCFGRTPKFEAKKDIVVDPSVGEMTASMDVNKGVVGGVTLYIPEGIMWGSATGPVKLITTISGQKYTPELFDILIKAIKQQGIEFTLANSARAASSA